MYKYSYTCKNISGIHNILTRKQVSILKYIYKYNCLYPNVIIVSSTYSNIIINILV